jgi:putative nucleotidyltransferase with HDIG domain
MDAPPPIPTLEPPLVLRERDLTEEQIDAFVDALYQVLLGIGKEEIHDQLSYCLRELTENAVRANRKRRVFRQAGLDIANPADYEKGVALLQQDDDEAPPPDAPDDDDGTVELFLGKTEKHVVLRIANSAQMVEAEQRRVNQRLAAAQLYETIDEVFEQVQDDSESAGFGLVMLGMLLRRLGVPDYGFHFASANGWTQFQIDLPLALVSDEDSEELTDALSSEIKSLPQVPQSIHSLRELLRKPDVDYPALAKLIRRDPALALEVLRMANSPVYRRSQRIDSCEVALSLLGLRGLRGILDTFGARKALEGHYSAELLERLWAHSAEVAELAAAIGRQLRMPEPTIEVAYVAGLLHDMGRIILEGRDPATYGTLRQFCEQRHATTAAVESLIAGVNHTRIGARMAEHWNLPEHLTQAIRYSRAPLSAPEAARQCAQLIYLAHPIARRLRGDAKEYDVDESILASFGLDVPGGLDGLAERIAKARA